MEAAARNFERARLALMTYRMEVLCAGILLAMALNLVAVTARKSITADELVLIPAAYYHLVTNDFHLVTEHPPLCKLLAGLPLLFIQPNEPQPQQIDPSISRADLEWSYAMRFWQDNRPQFETISFWARVPMIALTIALGLLTFIFARDVFGARAALFAVVLFALEPTFLAHGRVVQTDMVAAFGLLLSVFAVYRYWQSPDWKHALWLGAATGIGMLTKFSMLILGPVLLILAVVLFWRSPRRRAVIASHSVLGALMLLFVINAGYFFHHRPVVDADAQWLAKSFPTSSANLLMSVRALRLILPTDFVMGVYWQLHHSQEGHPAGLLGMYSQRGWWYYFPVAFALKTTIAFLIVALGALGWATYRVLAKRDRQMLFLLIPFALYTIFVMMSPIDIGIRYYLPAYSFLFILVGALFDSVLRMGKSQRSRLAVISVIVILLGSMCWETIRSYPNYTSYMNQFASARPHWWYLSDSNVEWGDEVKELAEYLRARGETRTRALLLAGYITLGFYGVEYVDALSPNESAPPRYLALGASFLNGSTVPGYDLNGKRVSETERVNTFDEFRHRTPEAVIGNSIYVYRIHE